MSLCRAPVRFHGGLRMLPYSLCLIVQSHTHLPEGTGRPRSIVTHPPPSLPPCAREKWYSDREMLLVKAVLLGAVEGNTARQRPSFGQDCCDRYLRRKSACLALDVAKTARRTSKDDHIPFAPGLILRSSARALKNRSNSDTTCAHK